jgi:hypothetical protein
MLRILGRHHSLATRAIAGAAVGAGIAFCCPLLFELGDVRGMPDPVSAGLLVLGWLISIPGWPLMGRGLLTFAFLVLFWATLGAFVFARWRGRPIAKGTDGAESHK